jgi:hypothetical protein
MTYFASFVPPTPQSAKAGPTRRPAQLIWRRVAQKLWFLLWFTVRSACPNGLWPGPSGAAQLEDSANSSCCCCCWRSRYYETYAFFMRVPTFNKYFMTLFWSMWPWHLCDYCVLRQYTSSCRYCQKFAPFQASITEQITYSLPPPPSKVVRTPTRSNTLASAD